MTHGAIALAIAERRVAARYIQENAGAPGSVAGLRPTAACPRVGGEECEHPAGGVYCCAADGGRVIKTRLLKVQTSNLFRIRLAYQTEKSLLVIDIIRSRACLRSYRIAREFG